MRTMLVVAMVGLCGCAADEVDSPQGPSGGGGKADSPTESVALVDVGNADVRRALSALDVDADGLLTADDVPNLEATELAHALTVWSSYLVPAGPPTVQFFRDGRNDATIHVGDTVGVSSMVALADRSEVGRGYVILLEEKTAGYQGYFKYRFRFVEPGTYHIEFPLDPYSAIKIYDVTVEP